MDKDQYQDQILLLLTRQVQALEGIEVALKRMMPTNYLAPNWQYPLEDYASFNWENIEAVVVSTDRWGATVVNWRGQQFVRRSPDNKFGEAIWFSRSAGKDENGENKYEKLISFKPLSKVEVEPIPDKVVRYLQ